MNQENADTSLPPRLSLVDRVVGFLRHGIDIGRWGASLPTEAELCRELKVSRVTLRKAIAQLVRERWITPGGRGRPHRPTPSTSHRPSPAKGSIIRLLTPYLTTELGSQHQHIRRAVSECIGSAGYWIEIEHKPGLFEHFDEAELARLDSKPGTAAWILSFSTPEMQKWFEGRDRPAVALGRRHEGVHNLNSIFPDSQAVARHVVGMFRTRGHSNLVYFIDRFTSLGDRLCAAEFVRSAKLEGAQAQVVTHGRSRESVCQALIHALAGSPAPTALFSSCPEHCITILCQLQSAGIRVPEAVSLVCGWDDAVLDFAVPPITRYCIEPELMGRKLGEMLLDQIHHGIGKVRVAGIMAEFEPGGTLLARKG